ncbi:MAG: formate/nitrite transporter family protein [Lachnospiraceae bacterium]|nr:formate/nitrite transporter family protein [Lachnospiraceae bacterium]
MSNYNTHEEIVKDTIKVGIKKAGKPWYKTLLFGILAGAFIAIGAQGSNFAIHGISDYGIAKTVAGVIFPVGLMMIVFVGGELFTGNCLLIMATLDKKIKASQMVKNLTLVYIGNLIGALFIALLINGSGQLDTSHGLLGAYTIKVAAAKVAIDPMQAFVSGILCNIVVCMAILMASSAKDIAGKAIAMFFPLFVFVVSGFEHCIANMYYIFSGMMAARNTEYVTQAVQAYGISQEKIDSMTIVNSLKNFIPVTIGNIIGGVVCIGALIYFLNKEKKVVCCE